MDKTWMRIEDRALPAWQKGMREFLDMAFAKVAVADTIKCPCCRCLNRIPMTRDKVTLHLCKYGMHEAYTRWTFHGEEWSDEPSANNDDDVTNEVEQERCDDASAYEMIHDMIRGGNLGSGISGGIDDSIPVGEPSGNANVMDGGDEELHMHREEEPNTNAQKFFQLLRDAEQKLYPGCKKLTKLSFIVRVFQMKCLHGLTNKAIDSILELHRMAAPDDHLIPESFYSAQKIIRDLGLNYEKIDACVNDCVLYRNEYANLEQCPICKESRWKSMQDGMGNEISGNIIGKKKKNVAKKILRYFPLTHRLQRLFMTKRTASDMRWHKEGRVDDGVLRHPADSMAWKKFDDLHTGFASDSRNVRLGLATDGFNPFGVMSVSYSVWPVILIPYNLPPWMCLKQPFWIMSMLIPGPKSPGNDIDVYLQPLIEELKQLWEYGVETYDASLKNNFQLHAAVLWTINDFPAYAVMSGWSTKGQLACPCCHKDTCSYRLKFGRKQCYMGHRRFLDSSHAWRKNKSNFDNTRESRRAPSPLSGDEVIQQFENFEQVTFGKITKKRKRDDTKCYNWRKKSIFFELPYWKTLLLRHNLDVMHIEKNIFDSILGTLLDIEGKTKDGLNARLDLELMGIRKDLHPYKSGDKYVLPPAYYTLSNDEKRSLLQFLKEVKMPDAYASNIGRCMQVKECKVVGLKTHDCHVIFQRLLPLVIRGILPKHVCQPLIQLSSFFVALCSKELSVEELEGLNCRIVEILCKLEQIFPPAFFDVMVHLPIHLAYEAKLGGPVQYRWMYGVERYLRTLKEYVRNRAHPEGSIAEGYISEESMTFCSWYLSDIDTKLNRPERNIDTCRNAPCGFSIFTPNDRTKRSNSYEWLERKEHYNAQHYVLTNCDEVAPWVDEHIKELTATSSLNVERRHKEQFVSWFESRIGQLSMIGDERVNEQLLALANGPDRRVRVYTRYCTNGFLFRTKGSERNLKTQNSGVVVKGDECAGCIDWFGVIEKIIGLEYLGGKLQVVLFKCNWFEVPPQGRNQSRGYKKDEYGFISIDTTRLAYKDDPFILGSQAEQVYYAKDIHNPNWSTVIKVTPRNLFAMPNREDEVEDGNFVLGDEPYQLNDLSTIQNNMGITEEVADDINGWGRSDIDGVSVDVDIFQSVNVEDHIFEDNETDVEDDDTSVDDGDITGCLDNDIDDDDDLV